MSDDDLINNALKDAIILSRMLLTKLTLPRVIKDIENTIMAYRQLLARRTNV